MNLASIAIRGSSGLHPEVETFISASYANITDNAIITDLNNLAGSVKGYGLWTPSLILYPLVGGNANAHSYNLVDPTQYRITWAGGLTHNANGVTGNGSSGYGNTGIVPSSVLTLNSVHLSCYIRVNSDGGSKHSMGCNDAGVTNNLSLSAPPGVLSTGTNSTMETASTTATGWLAGNRTGASTANANWIRNGSVLSKFAGASTARSGNALALLARNNNGTIDQFSLSNYAFFTVGPGLTNTQAANLYTAIQAFQTARGRNV